MEEFNVFTEAHTCKDTLKAFRELSTKLGLDDTPHEQFFDKLRSGFSNWKIKRFLDQLQKKFAPKTQNSDATKVLVVGAGPCGLRIAIETAFMGCKVVVIDKREAFTRNNVLHLWPFTVTDLKNIGIKHFFGKFCQGELNHISIRRLQICLMKIALVLGVEVYTSVEFDGLQCPQKNGGSGWKAVCKPQNQKVADFEFDVLVAATGARDALCEYKLRFENGTVIKQGFERKEFRGQLSIAITANFVNSNTAADMKAKEIGGVARHFNQSLFSNLETKKGIRLENMVYFKDETHYFVMTPTKASLVRRGVFKADLSDASKLLERKNIDVQRLLAYARDAANFCTDNAMVNMCFAKNSHGMDDVAMLDFSSKVEAVNASHIIERNGKKLLIGLIGDSLLEPFWPQGTGCARGFLGALDTAWMIGNWKSMKEKPLDIIAQRESVYKVLSQTTQDNISKKFSNYTVEPKSRYSIINLKAVTTEKAKDFYDDVQDDFSADAVSPVKKPKQSDESVDLPDLLLWCQKVLEKHTQFKIKDLTTSWRSGCELGCLIHVFRPHIIKMEDLDRTNALRTMEIVVNIAKREFEIFPVLAVSKMVNFSSENEVEMASYLSQFYQLFHGEPIPEITSSDNSVLGDEKRDITETNIVKPRTSRVQIHDEKVETDENINDICYLCKKVLFFLEKLSVENVFCHRRCLKCERCNCELNLGNYRTQKSYKGRVRFFCIKHAGPNAKFTQSIRKRPTLVLKARDDPQPSKDAPNVANADRVKHISDKPRIPARPDFLARRVTSASMRRIDFYNSGDDEKEVVTEDIIFEHNFGVSVRGGLGAFTLTLPESDENVDDSSNEDSDDDIEERLEATLGPNIDKNMTVKDASEFWQTLKRDTKPRSFSRHKPDISAEKDSSPIHSKARVTLQPNVSTREHSTMQDEQEEENDDLESTICAAPDVITNLSDVNLPDDKQHTNNRNSRENNEMFERALKDLKRESRELEDKRSNFSVTCFQPQNKNIDKGPEANQPEKVIGRNRPQLKRCDSDPTEERHAQRVQLAARKLAIQRQQNKIFMAQEIKRQLEEADVELRDVEQQGVEIETKLKDNTEILEENKQSLRRQLCSLYTRRQKLLQYEAELRSASEHFLPSQEGEAEETCPSEYIPRVEEENSFDEMSVAFGSETFNETIKASGVILDDNKTYETQNASETKSDKYTSRISDAVPDTTFSDTVRAETYGLLEIKDAGILSERPCETTTEKTNQANDVYKVTTNVVTLKLYVKVVTRTHTGVDSSLKMSEDDSRCEVSGGDIFSDDIDKLTFVDDRAIIIYWECPFCTLHNDDGSSFCSACYAWKCNKCTHVNDRRRKECEMCHNSKPPRDHHSRDHRHNSSRESFA
ncbi:F-actin-monooxygenase MICAL1-like isoform X2 [Mytilus californianus]|uniref:F-actin-monooxygenase MICAL1-like isoform X2 n=1 Tax=Mytilus californianus TaxID=6549 RepID=UPI002246CA11|nr:F-actin-monooxygenase MICAL1-like isoform X2 [Mytilus californianus]